MFAVTEQGRQVEAAKALRTQTVLPGRSAEAVQNGYLAPGRARVRPSDDLLAAGHRTGGELVPGRGEVSAHLRYQAVAPSAGATLTQHGDRPGPFSDAVVVHNSRAQVSQMDEMRAANVGLAGQLGAAAPSPVPGQPGPHTAVPDNGAPFRGVVPTDPVATYLTGPRGARQ